MRRHIRMISQVSFLLCRRPYICISCLRTIFKPSCNQLRLAASTTPTQINPDIRGKGAVPTKSAPCDDKLESLQAANLSAPPFDPEKLYKAENDVLIAPCILGAKDSEQLPNKNSNVQAVSLPSRARKIRTRTTRHNRSSVDRRSKHLKDSKKSKNALEEEDIEANEDGNRRSHSNSSRGTAEKVALYQSPTNQRKLLNMAQKQNRPKTPTGSSLKRNRMKVGEIETINVQNLELIPLDKSNPPIPSLSYGLERVLFNPGVYHLRDPRSRVFNFDPYLQSIMPVEEFDFGALKKYVTSSQDETLTSTAASQNKKYSGSTSSMTSVLGHFHFLLSHWRPINMSKLSRGFPEGLISFTNILRAPAAIFLRWKDGTYAIDADKEFDTANILMMLGKSMEKLLTLPTMDFEKFRKENSDQISEVERNEPESFHYTTIGDFLLRSQLDAHDPRLPGTGVFDLKTRAVLPIRMDAANYQDGAGYEIRSLFGRFESYEREYYDMMRSAFLKYSLQVRMGRMDGVFVAFHNTERIFGFQYISLPELDEALHGQSDVTLGDAEFKLSLGLLNRILDRATKKFPQKSLRLIFETRETSAPFTYIFAEPVTDDDIKRIQDSKKAEIEEWERNVLGLGPDRPQDLQDEIEAGWKNLQAKVEETVESDELGISESADDLEDKNSFIPSDNFAASKFSDRPQDGWSEHFSNKESETRESLQATDESIDAEVRSLDGFQNLDDTSFAKENITESVSAGTYEAIPSITQEQHAAKSANETIRQQDTIAGQRKNSSSNVMESSIKPESLEETGTEKQILAMTLTIRNKVNDKYVPRPVSFEARDKWCVEYAVAEVTGQERSHNLYRKAQMRRAKIFKKTSLDAHFGGTLRRINKSGRNWRQTQDKIDEVEPIKVLNDISV